MANCVMCGAYIPDDQGSSSCSMCYGDPAHGKDGYYEDWLEKQQYPPEREQEPESPQDAYPADTEN